ncbi:gfo/Idh/MocA family oxidoreductase [Agrobacterium vitis]|uniref:Gfo/Idh/MocA family protein n=1 Tax=Agrobacterium vitis TaxID=373 RepID=UPI0012E86E07|nr:Gfo/Idh/MocA family oxidoreductase [Agrobacterium vitis]MVA22044.1 gfo/Idh/MocA family oxidoreductase [Agrobacterium vitis]
MATRIAILGAGLIGREHIALVLRHPSTELAAIVDPSDDARRLAADVNVPHYTDTVAMLDEVKPDGVVIALPNALHIPAAMNCVERGISCLVEKPIADTVEAAKELVEASVRLNVPVLIGHQRRYSPDIQMAKRAIDEGRLGRLVAVHGMWLADKPEKYFDAEWRRKPGGGPLLINLIHDIDCLRYICGDIESVRAFSSNAVRGFEVADTASVSLRFGNGALGTLLMSDAVVSPYNWDTASGQALYFPHQPENCYYLGGTKGLLAAPTMDLWYHPNQDGSWQDPLARQHLTLDGSRAYDNQLDHFLAVIDRQASPLISAEDGMKTLATVLAIDIAAREDRTVNISELVS